MALGLPEGKRLNKEQLAIECDIEIATPQGYQTLRALLDSGAERDCISQRAVVRLGLKPTEKSPLACAVNGGRISTYGIHTCETHAIDAEGEDGSSTTSFLATDIQGFDAILGFPWLKQVNPIVDWAKGSWTYRPFQVDGALEHKAAKFMKEVRRAGRMYIAYITPAGKGACIRSIHTSPQGKEVEVPNEYKDFLDVFSTDGAAALPRDARAQHEIELEEGKKPPYGPIYALSQRELEILREYLRQNLASGRIRRSTSAAGAPILFVPKADGTLRLCVDYRGLNRVTKKNRYPLPLLSEILDRVSGARYFTKLDLKDAYHRIPIAERDQWKTAFRTRYGHFKYTVMPFGLTNAPATFQAYINEALQGILDDCCVAYMDDILIYSRTAEEHATHVRSVLERLRKYSLYANLAKCEFWVQEVAFLGYRVGVAGVSMDKSKSEAIATWPRPGSFRDIQVFLGFANFYRGFIRGYSAVVAPITDLLAGMQRGKKTGPFEWNDAAERAFHTLKACFQDATVLRHFDPAKTCRIETDASKEAIGAVLSQECESPDGRKRFAPIAFLSKKHSKEQRNYGTGDQEMLAIVAAFKEWRHYLDAPAGRTVVLCDHEALQSFMTTKSLQGRQIRWAEYLAQFDFEIRYRRGKDNAAADSLSRRPDHMVRDEPDGDPLKDLVALRLRDAGEEYLERKAQCSDLRIGLLTRAMAHTVGNLDSDEVLRVVPREESSMLGASEATAPASMQRPTFPVDPDAVLEEEAVPATPEIPTSLENRMLHLQASDGWCQQREWEKDPSKKMKGEFKGDWTVDAKGLVRCNGAVYVPNDPATRAGIMRLNHDDPWQGGHFGHEKTQAMIMRYYYWPRIRADINEYIDTCDVCQRMKVPRHKPYGLLAPLPIPKGPWEDISLDFIVGLPPSMRMGVAYDSVLVIVDRFSKMVRYIPTVKEVKASEVGQLLLDEVISKFGTPRSIVSDRGSVFTSAFWGDFCYYLATRRCFSTAFHPQTDGQTERMNQTLECYLRCYIAYEQDDWASLLACAEYAANSAVSATTKSTPFELVYSFTPSLNLNVARDTQVRREQARPENQHAREAASRLEESLEAAVDLRARANASMEKYYNKKRTARTFKAGDLVRLATRNLRLRRVHKKLADKFVGPFVVEKAIGANAYRLQLPAEYGRVHPTFHVSLLEPYRAREGCEPPAAAADLDEDQFEVEEVLDEQTFDGATHFYVKWVGWDAEDNTWEPEAHMRDAVEKVREFRERRDAKKRRRVRAS
jgi:transposase InsO family protein